MRPFQLSVTVAIESPASPLVLRSSPSPRLRYFTRPTCPRHGSPSPASTRGTDPLSLLAVCLVFPRSLSFPNALFSRAPRAGTTPARSTAGFGFAALAGLRSLPKRLATTHLASEEIFFGSPRKKRSLAWGAGTTCFMVPRQKAGRKRRKNPCIKTAFPSSAL